MNKKQIVENLASGIGGLLHTGLRKWTDDPQSGVAWRAISEMDDEEWLNVCRQVAEYIYPEFRKAIIKQIKK